MTDVKTLFRVAEMDDATPSIDLHGKTVEEARQDIDYFLSDLLYRNIRIGKIIHGKGMDRLSRTIPDFLRVHDVVEAIHSPGGTHETGAVIYVSVKID